MYEEIENRFNKNIDRVSNLIGIYRNTRGQGQGRRSVKTTDVLRAAVVFLHASLEDVLRSLIRERLPDCTADTLNDVPLVGTPKGSRAERFFLGSLVPLKGKTVDQVIIASVDEYYEQISFNDSTEIVGKLRKIRINYDDDGLNYLSLLNEMIRRRHSIVHQADRNPHTGLGEFHAQGINPETLDLWMTNVKSFVVKILEIARN